MNFGISLTMKRKERIIANRMNVKAFDIMVRAPLSSIYTDSYAVIKPFLDE